MRTKMFIFLIVFLSTQLFLSTNYHLEAKGTNSDHFVNYNSFGKTQSIHYANYLKKNSVNEFNVGKNPILKNNTNLTFSHPLQSSTFQAWLGGALHDEANNGLELQVSTHLQGQSQHTRPAMI